MSMLKNARKRLFSFSKQGQDPLNEETESRVGVEDSMRRLSVGEVDVEEKRKPSGYVFLQQDNPSRIWREVENYGEEPDDEAKDFDRYEAEKVCRNSRDGTVATCKIIYKFSDDAFDDYLYEIGLLTVKYPRFEDVMGELEMLKELDHTNVLKFYDVFYFDTKLWIYTEFCPNGSVEELIDDLNKPLTITQAHYVLRDVLFGLEFLNEKRRILHRDLKSANLLIGQDMSIKIANFDVSAKNLNARSPKLTNINDKRYLYVKSPHYVAPEILKCDQYAMNNFKSDIWSFGIVCIELLEMLPPNSHLHPEAIIDQAKIPNWRGPNLPNLHSWPSEFSDLVTKCLNVKYDDRPSASELQKHPFFQRTQSSKAEFEALLNERKTHAYGQLKERFERIESTMQKMITVRTRPEVYIRNYFDDLRSMIDQKAEDAKQRIEAEHMRLIASVKSYEDAAVKEAESVNRSQAASLDKLVLRFNTHLKQWKESFSAEENEETKDKEESSKKETDEFEFSHVINENAVHKTKTQLKNLKKTSDTKLAELKSTIFKNRNYTFQARTKDPKFGEIIVDDFNPNAAEPSGPQRVRRSSSVVAYKPDEDEDDATQNSSNRPQSRYIRIEIKPLIKKRYSIY